MLNRILLLLLAALYSRPIAGGQYLLPTD